MFIDLKNGQCINADEVMGAAFGKQANGYIIKITLRPFNPKNKINMTETVKPAQVEVVFKDIRDANKYIEKYFNIESYFD